MTKAEKSLAEIVVAAEALEVEVALLETISRSVRKIELTSEKKIARAAAELSETLALPDRLAERLKAVAAALGRMQERQQAALEPLTAFAVELQRRTKRLGEHMESFSALGQAAGEVSALLAAGQGQLSAVAQAEARLQRDLGCRASALRGRAGRRLPEIAREADVLKQRLAALRMRIGQTN